MNKNFYADHPTVKGGATDINVGGKRKAVSGEMAKYRQELRDIPKQEGFPYCVVFPTKK